MWLSLFIDTNYWAIGSCYGVWQGVTAQCDRLVAECCDDKLVPHALCSIASILLGEWQWGGLPHVPWQSPQRFKDDIPRWLEDTSTRQPETALSGCDRVTVWPVIWLFSVPPTQHQYQDIKLLGKVCTRLGYSHFEPKSLTFGNKRLKSWLEY